MRRKSRCGQSVGLRTLGWMIRAVVIAVVALAFANGSGHAMIVKDDPGDVRVTGVCSAGAGAKLRLKADKGRIEVRFEVDHTRAGSWRVALVHERRVVWKGVTRTSGTNHSFELRRTLPDLPGNDSVTARAWGPQGLTCHATATLAEA
jgi:hypothetical protein